MHLFPIDQIEPPSFDNLDPAQGQAEAVRLVRQIAAGGGRPGAYLWGDAGFGKSHLLAAGMSMAKLTGVEAAWLADSKDKQQCNLLAADDVEKLGEADQQRLFAFLSRSLDGEAAAVLIAGSVPARMLSLRADLRTRIEQLQPVRLGRLADAEMERALIAYARRCGREVNVRITQLLVHNCPRDMVSLAKALRSVDQFAIASDRSLSVGTVRSWLASRSQLL